MLQDLEFTTIEQARDWYDWDRQNLLENINNQVVKVFDSKPESLLDNLSLFKLMIDMERETSVS